MLPDPGTTPPSLNLILGIFGNLNPLEIAPALVVMGTLFLLGNIIDPAPRPLPFPFKNPPPAPSPPPPRPAKPLRAIAFPIPCIAADNSGKATTRAPIPVIRIGNDFSITFVTNLSKPAFFGFAKKSKNFIRILPRNNFTIPPRILLKIFLIGDTTVSMVFCIDFFTFLPSSNLPSLFLLFSFSNLL